MNKIYTEDNYIILQIDGKPPRVISKKDSRYQEEVDHFYIACKEETLEVLIPFSEISGWTNKDESVIFTENSLREFLRKNSSFYESGGSDSAIESTLQSIEENTRVFDIEIEEIEFLNDGLVDVSGNNIEGISITLIGSGGTINSIPYPNGSTRTYKNNIGGVIITSIPFTVPTSTNGRVIVSLTKRI